jgi:hypothetical protein
MKNLAMSQVMVGANFWDAPGHVMSGSNDPPTRREIFAWIKKNEKTLYLPRVPMHPIGVYFSPKSRDYDPNGFLPSYRGALIMLLQSHRELQVVTPRTLAAFQGEALILPNASFLSDAEKASLKNYVAGGGKLILTGKNRTGFPPSPGVKEVAEDPGARYLANLEKDFTSGLATLPVDFLNEIHTTGTIQIDAPATIAINMALVDGTPHAFLANFAGLVPSKVAVPAPASGVRVSVPAKLGSSLAFLPFLGEMQVVKGVEKGQVTEFVLPAVDRGAVVWVLKN